MPFRASLRAFSVCSFASVVLVACSGASDSGLFDGPGVASPDAGGTTGDDTNEPGGDSGAASNPGHDAGGSGTEDAAPSGGKDANPPVDSAPPHATATIDCNVSNSVHTCDATTSVCCRTTATTSGSGSGGGGGNGNPTATFACTAPADCAQQNMLAIPCDNADDCAAQGSPSGTVCCVTADANSGVATSVACVAQSDCSAEAQTWLCNGTSACPASDECDTSTTTIPGYMICRAQ